jgi:hypothetical protein
MMILQVACLKSLLNSNNVVNFRAGNTVKTFSFILSFKISQL